MASDWMKPDYLRTRYGKAFRAIKGDDGIWNLRTKDKTLDGVEGDVYAHGPGRLGVLLSPQRGRKLAAEVPETFALHQVGEDAAVLVFDEEKLESVADTLHMRRRRQMSPEEAAERGARLKRFHFRRADESRKEGQISTNAPPTPG